MACAMAATSSHCHGRITSRNCKWKCYPQAVSTATLPRYRAPHGDPLDFDAVQESIHIERVEFDEGWLDANHPALDAFYQRLLAELDNPAHLEPLRVAIDSERRCCALEIDRLRQRQKEAAEPEKMALDMVALAGR